MQTSKRILLAGAGYVGSKAAELLVAAGHDVVVLRRSPKPVTGAKLLQADLLDKASLTNLPPCEHLVYCAAAEGGGEEAYERIYLQGLQNLLETYRQRGEAPHVVFTSSTSVYAEAQGEWVEEATATLVNKGPSRFLVAAEEYLRAGPWKATILRYGGIYGPGRTSFLQRVKEKREFIWEGNTSLYSNRIHRDDCAQLIQWAITEEKAWGQSFSAVDDDPAERNSLILWMCDQLGICPAELQKTKDFALIPHRGNKRVSNKRLHEAGYQWLYPTYREGYRSLIREVL